MQFWLGTTHGSSREASCGRSPAQSGAASGGLKLSIYSNSQLALQFDAIWINLVISCHMGVHCGGTLGVPWFFSPRFTRAQFEGGERLKTFAVATKAAKREQDVCTMRKAGCAEDALITLHSPWSTLL